MTITHNFKLTTLILFCLATVLPCLAAPALKQVPMVDPNIQIQSLLLPDEDGVGSLDNGMVVEGLNNSQEAKIALEIENADTLAESVSETAFNATTQSLSPSAQLAQMASLAIARTEIPQEFGTANLNPNSRAQQGQSQTATMIYDARMRERMEQMLAMQQRQSQIAAMIDEERMRERMEQIVADQSLQAKPYENDSEEETDVSGIVRWSPELVGSTKLLATFNGPVIVQLPTGAQLNQTNIAATLTQAQAMLAQAKGAVPASAALTPAGIALDEQISQSVPKGLVIAAQALGTNGELTHQAAELFGAVKPQPGNSYIMMGDPKVTAEMAKALIKAGVAPKQMRAINLTKIQAGPVQFSGLNAQLSGIGSATVGENNQTKLAANGMALLQTTHRISPQDFVSQASGVSAAQTPTNNS